MDQCKNCVARGSIEMCEDYECSYHELWYVQQLRERVAELEKRFPMQNGPDIDWKTAEIIYEQYSKLFGTSQSLERLAKRGGFGWSEVELFFKRKSDGNDKD